jgi:hypothetical protein
MKAKLMSLALLAMMILSAVAVIPSFAAGNSMYISPASVDGVAAGGYGATFTLTVWLDVASNTNSWQTYMVWNKNQLSLVGNSYTGSGKSLWAGALLTDNPAPSTGSHDATRDYLLYGEVLKASAEKTGAGSLFNATFQIIAAPAKYGALVSDITLDTIGVFSSSVLDKNFAPVVPAVVYSNCHYSYVWTTPPKPTPALSPTSQTFGPLPPPAVGQTFVETVTLNGLSADWNCHNVTFHLLYNSTLLSVTTWTVAPLWTTNTVVNGAGDLSVFVGAPSSTPSGNVLIITVTFQVMYQGVFPKVDTTTIDFANVVIMDTLATIPYNFPVKCDVTIKGIQLLPLPYFQVSSPTMGPGPSIGALFNVTVSLKDLHPAYYAVGAGFRLTYDPALITPVAAYEGPFFPHYTTHSVPPYTWFISFFEPENLYPEHVLVGDLILPNGTGRWNAPFPNSAAYDSTICIITFKVVYQSFGEQPMTSELGIFDEAIVGLVDPLAVPDQDIIYLLLNPAHNGTYTITTDWPGRVLDIYTQYPAPYGGQGWNMPSDMFWPQKQVELYANVTYNYWPVQQKDVAFEIRDNQGNLWDILVARTDVNGVAHASFRIPWPCDHPETLFGVWTVTSSVDIACIVVNDTMHFHFDYMVELFSVTTDKFEYNHCDFVKVTITYGSHAQQTYPVVLYVVIKDNLNVPIGYAFISTTVGGAIYCQYKTWTKTVSIHIPKFAAAGIAGVYVTAYNKLPTLGGTAWCPTYGLLRPDGTTWPTGSTIPLIAIQPY